MAKQEKNFGFHRDKHSPTVTLTGDLSLNNITSLKEELLKLYQEGKVVNVLVDKPEIIDLGFVQLLRSFQFSLAEKGVKSTVHFKLSDEQKGIFDRSGIKLEY